MLVVVYALLLAGLVAYGAVIWQTAMALERLREPGAAAIDVVVLDLFMPVLDGFQTLQQIRG